MDKIQFSDGTKTSSAKVTIDGVDYPVTPARYTGATPLSSVVMNTMQTNIENAIDQNADNIGGQDYDSTATYEEGDIVKYEGQLYICIEAIETAEEWDSTKWEETDVLSSAGGNEVAIGDSSAVTSKTKLWIDTDDETDVFSEVVDSLSGNELDKAPSVHAVKQALAYSTTESIDTGTFNVSSGVISKSIDLSKYKKIIFNIRYGATSTLAESTSGIFEINNGTPLNAGISFCNYRTNQYNSYGNCYIDTSDNKMKIQLYELNGWAQQYYEIIGILK